MTRLLIIEDNPELVANLYAFLEPLGYVLDDARDGASGLRRATENDYDAVLLDLMLPRLDGMTLCHRLRQEFQNPIPILMLTARDQVDDRVQGLALGADDYLVKPFSLAELDARIKALVRRAQGRQVDTVIAWQELQVDTRSPQAWRCGKAISLTPTAHKLLVSLVRAAPAVVRKQDMEYLIWGDEPPDSGALRTHIHELRLQVDRRFDYPLIATVHSVGWRLSNPAPGQPE
ncbi:response regulator transcription factor [Stenotrophomonas maltophilia]|jgi:DNA-binding response OmpR family regulator|uniref:response regulator transcription factor n=1 Tax=Stenotrophomonas maltophilia TaxID=40324 RepID=UPI0007F01FA9|nr:response regulator transcription factor [Stenotrophomonas maltophilia]MBN4937522.1 response regulator transcription factor [Stenotrophomonas maltophilia]MCU1022561.1 response regulator transcription factor [Stenotrophomonas maltophilia]MCU1093152.1 response regulator transcription factor [Stenotrophomonas maltophilia]OBU51520.1 two-component system response regulator [Stenotrophomonas maltophilia]HEL3863561.1 response regulator transcription factor [Stenotrophomonas maltophilia]